MTYINTVIRLLFIMLFLPQSTLMFAEKIPTQFLQSSEIKLEEFEIGYFIDQSENMSFDEARQQHFQLSTSKLTLGPNAKVTWTKVELKNTTQSSLKVYLHNPYIYHSQGAELYEITDGSVIRKRIINLDSLEGQQWLYRGNAVFDIELPPNQHRTLFLKSIVLSHQWFTLSLYDEDQSKRALMGLYTEIAALVGMFFALTIYNLLLFFSSRLKEHIYYACYLISGGTWIALCYGLLADTFSIYGSAALKGQLILGGLPIFLFLFMMSTFETRKKYPIEHWILTSVLVVFICELIYALFDIVTALHISTILAGVMMVISFLVSLSMFIRKHPIAPFFLLGHVLFIIFGTMSLLFYRGVSDFHYINSHGVGIGIVLEALVLSLIIAYRVRALEKIKESQVDLILQASTDSLTKLLNRRHFNLKTNLLLAQPAKYPASIVIFDIDKFKNINDAYGHNVGDKVIIAMADILEFQCRHQDIIARYGGEEFIIFMPNTRQAAAYSLAERVRESVERFHVDVEGHQPIHFTISLGITEINSQSDDLQEAINQADKALYKAKNNGRNQTQIYTIGENIFNPK
ncbi:sensor domain-containing diguanylate cyclase [Marinomonas sp.]|nr:diguanylate cyclase [Marinomonas sp.]MDB4837559.1 sensor domain-containing diguanylate cyclase [Marinomonas sp.]